METGCPGKKAKTRALISRLCLPSTLGRDPRPHVANPRSHRHRRSPRDRRPQSPHPLPNSEQRFSHQSHVVALSAGRLDGVGLQQNVLCTPISSRLWAVHQPSHGDARNTRATRYIPRRIPVSLDHTTIGSRQDLDATGDSAPSQRPDRRRRPHTVAEIRHAAYPYLCPRGVSSDELASARISELHSWITT